MGVDCGFFLLCIKPLYERDWKKYFLFSLLAILYHITAVITLPLWFLTENKIHKYVYALIIPISFILYFSNINFVNIISFIPIEYIEKKYDLYEKIGNIEKSNVFNIFFLGKCLIYYVLLWKTKLLFINNKYSILLIKIYGISLSLFILFYTLPSISRRLNDMYGVVEIITIPMVIYIFKEKKLFKFCITVFSFALLFVNIFSLNLIKK
jgi:hypothetical protein